MGIGSTLKALLEARGMKPGTLATSIGVSRNTIYSIIKRDNDSIDLSVLEKIAEALGVSTDYFLLAQGALRNPGERTDDKELWELRDQMRRRPEMRTLFSLTKNATRESVERANKIIEALKDEDEKNGRRDHY